MKIVVKQAGSEDRHLEAQEGESILNFLNRHGFQLDAPCAGKGKCGKCGIKASGELSEPTEAEQAFINKGGAERLACQSHFVGPAKIEIAAKTFFSSVGGLGESEKYEIDPPLKHLFFGELDRQDATDLMTARKITKASIKTLNDLAILDSKREEALAVMWEDELLKILPKNKTGETPQLLAAAIDLGTTGLSVAIIDVLKAKVISQGTALNPQTSCGGDVISRITLASENSEKQVHLQKLILDGLKDLIKETAGEERLAQLMAVVISGNTTMIYLLAGIQPKGLAQSPYRPVSTKSFDLSDLAPNLGLKAETKIITSPHISAYIGGDITSGIQAVGLKKLPGTVLYIDIGTNGEIVLSHKGKLIATSCAAGPALEGMNIICGQRATPGAVDSFTMDSNFKYEYTTIGGAPASGICGSGLIDIAASLVDHGLIDKTGRLKSPENLPQNAPAWLADLSGGRFKFADPVFFDQKDIRQIQLAKGAIAAAVEMLLKTQDLDVENLDEIIIAGAFGFHLKPESLASIRLTPQDYKGPVRFVGNSSLAGSARVILNRESLAELDKLSSECLVLELGFAPEFQNVFLRHLRF